METEPKMDIVKEADQSEKNKNVQVNHDMQKIGKILSPLPVHWSGDVEVEITAEK